MSERVYREIFKVKSFWLALIVPIFFGITIGCFIGFTEGLVLDLSLGKKSFDVFWNHMRFPIAIGSLSIPLATWVIANHRTSQFVKSLKVQELNSTLQQKSLANQDKTLSHQAETQLLDSYYSHRDFFTTIYSRKIDTDKWEYIEKDDLPLIHAKLYNYSNLLDIKKIKLDSEKIEILENFFDFFSKQLTDSCIELLEIKKDFNNTLEDQHKASALAINTLWKLSSRFDDLSININFRRIISTQCPLSLIIKSYFEIFALYVDLIPEKNTPELYNNVLDDQAIAQAIINLINEITSSHDGVTISGLEESMQMKSICLSINPDQKYLVNSFLCRFKDECEHRYLVDCLIEENDGYVTLTYTNPYGEDLNIRFVEYCVNDNSDSENISGYILMNEEKVLETIKNDDNKHSWKGSEDELNKITSMIGHKVSLVSNYQRKERIGRSLNLSEDA